MQMLEALGGILALVLALSILLNWNDKRRWVTTIKLTSLAGLTTIAIVLGDVGWAIFWSLLLAGNIWLLERDDQKSRRDNAVT